MKDAHKLPSAAIKFCAPGFPFDNPRFRRRDLGGKVSLPVSNDRFVKFRHFFEPALNGFWKHYASFVVQPFDVGDRGRFFAFQGSGKLKRQLPVNQVVVVDRGNGARNLRSLLFHRGIFRNDVELGDLPLKLTSLGFRDRKPRSEVGRISAKLPQVALLCRFAQLRHGFLSGACFLELLSDASVKPKEVRYCNLLIPVLLRNRLLSWLDEAATALTTRKVGEQRPERWTEPADCIRGCRQIEQQSAQIGPPVRA